MLDVPSLGQQGGLAAERRVLRLVGCLLGQQDGVLAEDWRLLPQEGAKHSNISLREWMFLIRV